MMLLPMVASASDIAVQNSDGKMIYYRYINGGRELEVVQGSYMGSVNIPEYVHYMGRSIQVTSIGENAFLGCALTSITLPSSIKSIDIGAFLGCSGLTSITIPNSVTSIGADAFNNCRALNYISIPDGVTFLGPGAFANCSGLTFITIPSKITKIGTATFKGCSKLTTVTILGNVTKIGERAFEDCKSLTNFTVPSSVKNIAFRAFYGCFSLLSFSCMAEKVPKTHKTAFENTNISKATLMSPEEAVNAYKSADPWKGFKEVIEVR